MGAGLLNDLRYGLRAWRRRQGFAASLILMLGLGIGATSTVFAAAYGLLWRPFPYPNPERLVIVSVRIGGMEAGLTAEQYLMLRQLPVWQSAGVVMPGQELLRTGSRSQALPVTRISASLLPMLGLHPALGRNFFPSEEQPGHGAEALISDSLWRARFGGEASVLGRSIRLGERSYTVVGVMPADFDQKNGLWFGSTWWGGASKDAVWIPAVLTAADFAPVGFGAVQFYARIRAGIPLARTEAEVADYAASRKMSYRGQALNFHAMAAADINRQGPNRNALLGLLAAVSFLLLIACANLSALLLARGEERRQEIAMRQMLGASRRRIIGQLLAEGALLAAVGAMAGWALALFGTRLVHSLPLPFVRLDQVRLDVPALVFTLAATVMCCVLFSLAPALQLSAAPAAGLARRRDLSGLLIVAEVALTLMLLIGAGLASLSLARLYTVDTGIDWTHLAEITFQSPVPLLTAAQTAVFSQRALRATAALPGVQGVVVADGAPFDANDSVTFSVGAQPTSAEAWEHFVAPGYFALVGQAVRLGRGFADQDTAAAPGVVIVNQAWARHFAGGGSPLGMQLRFRHSSVSDDYRTVVGVVTDARDNSPEMAVSPAVYIPFAQWHGIQPALVIRALNPGTAAEEVRRALTAVLPDAPVASAVPVAALRGDDLAQWRVQSFAFVAFAGLALLFALAGIWALVAFAVQRRRREFGIRLALGASSSHILAQALRQAAALTAIGLGFGLAGAWALTRLLVAFLWNVKPTDLGVFAAAVLSFAAVALLAAYLPARAARNADPAVTLRCE